MSKRKMPVVNKRRGFGPALINASHTSHAPTNDRLKMSLARMRLAVRADASALGPLWREFRERIEAKFREVDS